MLPLSHRAHLRVVASNDIRILKTYSGDHAPNAQMLLFFHILRQMHNPGNFRGVSNQKAAGISSTFTDTMVPEIGMVDIESEWTAQDREQGASGGPIRVFLRPG